MKGLYIFFRVVFYNPSRLFHLLGAKLMTSGAKARHDEIYE